jgi:hypothetical protein
MNQINECNPEEIKMIYRRVKQLKREISQPLDEERIVAEKEKREWMESGEVREITILIHSHQYFHEPNKPSSYEYVIIDQETGKERRKVSDRIPEETGNRTMIYGIMDAISQLSKDRRCRIHIVTKGSWGFLKMKRQNKGVNGDLLEKLQSLLRESGHLIEAVESNEMINQYF